MIEATPSPLGHVITIDDERIRSRPPRDRVVRGSVEETLNALLDGEAARLRNAQRHERSGARRDRRAGNYDRAFPEEHWRRIRTRARLIFSESAGIPGLARI